MDYLLILSQQVIIQSNWLGKGLCFPWCFLLHCLPSTHMQLKKKKPSIICTVWLFFVQFEICDDAVSIKHLFGNVWNVAHLQRQYHFEFSRYPTVFFLINCLIPLKLCMGCQGMVWILVTIKKKLDFSSYCFKVHRKISNLLQRIFWYKNSDRR